MTIPGPIGNPSRKKRRRWLIQLIVAVILAVAIFGWREKLERAIVALVIYRAHVFYPPASIEQESSWTRLKDQAQFYWDFSALRVDRDRRVDRWEPVLKPLVRQINQDQAAGQGMPYSLHIYREIRWRLNFTSDTNALAARVADLRESLREPGEQELATLQQISDGSWGLGYTVWYLRLYYSIDHDNQVYPMRFLDRINSPGKLWAKLDSDLYNNYLRSGRFNREELDETFSALARFLFGNHQTNYPFDPRLPQVLMDFVNQWQNPVSGCWGQWVVDRRERVWKMDDMGMTFHIVSDLGGRVQHLDRIARRVLELDRVEFPAGIRLNGHYENHLNWDVIRILRYAWPRMDSATRQKARAEISRMLDWCTHHTMLSDGSFKVSDLDDTEGDAYFYGISFLAETGYFDPKFRFWTDQVFPEAAQVRARIMYKLKSIRGHFPHLQDDYQIMMQGLAKP